MTDEAKPIATDGSAVPPTRSAPGQAFRVAGGGGGSGGLGDVFGRTHFRGIENGPMMLIPGNHQSPYTIITAATAASAARSTRCAAISTSGEQCRVSARPARSPCTMCVPCTSRRPISPAVSAACCCSSTAADAWPPLSFAGGVEKFDDLLLAGSPTLIRRLAPVPVRLPLPSAEYQGSIYENQRAAGWRLLRSPWNRSTSPLPNSSYSDPAR